MAVELEAAARVVGVLAVEAWEEVGMAMEVREVVGKGEEARGVAATAGNRVAGAAS